MPGPSADDAAERTCDKESESGSSSSEECKKPESPGRKSRSSSPGHSRSRSTSCSPLQRASRSRSKSIDRNKERRRRRSQSSDRHADRRKSRSSPERRHRSRDDRSLRDERRRRSYSRERRSRNYHRSSRRSSSRGRSRSPERRRRSRSRERWRESSRRNQLYRRSHRRSRSRGRYSHDRSRSRSRPRSFQRTQGEKQEKVSTKVSEDTTDQKSGNGNTLFEKTSGLPLNTLKPGCPMTPQMAVQQAMAAMNAKAQALTGISLPTYYNPAAVNPLKYAEQVQKRKLLWQNKEKTETNSVASSSSSSSVWENLTFSQDQDGKMTAKFRKLMGIKSETAVEAPKPEEPVSHFKKQEELFRDLDHQYEVARMSTHTHRGVGLGYSSQPTAIFPPSK